MNLGDPDLELIDPTPNVHLLFVHFDQLFFWSSLACRTAVRWSKRMYSCAGTCSYGGKMGGGFVDIALSEPLLKLRPRKDLIETLLHEMIHAYLFITCRDQDRDGHGPNFKSHMHRINKLANVNISVYHNFHDEVELYLTHWWRCNGICQTRKPHFGIVRRFCNKPPGPTDYWWKNHLRHCGGTFVKFKEPQKTEKPENKKVITKPNADITKYIKINGSINNTPQPIRVVNNVTPKSFPGKREQSNFVDVLETVRNIWAKKQFTGQEVKNIAGSCKTCRNANCTGHAKTPNRKHKASSVQENTPPPKLKKIDDFFKHTAPSLLKDIYGQDFEVVQNDKKIVAIPSNREKIVAIPSKQDFKVIQTKDQKDLRLHLVDCPVCKAKVSSQEINRHLDECLNKDLIGSLSKDNNDDKIINLTTPSQSLPIRELNASEVTTESMTSKLKDSYCVLPEITPYRNGGLKSNEVINEKDFVLVAEHTSSMRKKAFETDVVDLTLFGDTLMKPITDNNLKLVSDSLKNNQNSADSYFDPVDVTKAKAVVKKIHYDKYVRKSDNFVIPKEEEVRVVDVGYLPSFLDDIAHEIKSPPIKIQPGTSVDVVSNEQKCPCCGDKVDKPLADHLDECLAFFNNNDEPEEAASTSYADKTIVIEDDEDSLFDETMTMNATGTKHPCPCCLKMIEEVEMNGHLDTCLR